VPKRVERIFDALIALFLEERTAEDVPPLLVCLEETLARYALRDSEALDPPLPHCGPHEKIGFLSH
jgi:hypothetical protein